jgi:RNA polymerase sigma-70 factor (ECF subfamily)
VDRDLRTASDEELVAILAAAPAETGGMPGEEGASAELFRRYRKKVYLWCFGYTHDLEEAVDCTQEIFIKLFRSAAGFEGRARFATWVYRVTRNHCLGLLARRSQRWRQRLVPLDEVDAADTSWLSGLREAELKNGLEKVLLVARRSMEEQELQAFVLHYRDGLTVNEITRVLGCENLTGARTLIQNARRKFRRLVELRGFSHDGS